METVRQPFFPLVMICQLELTSTRSSCLRDHAVSEIPFSGFPLAAARCNEGAAPLTHHGWMQPSSNARIDGPGWGWWILAWRLAVKNWRHIKMWSHFFLGNSMSSDMLRWVFETVKEGVDVYFMLVEGCWRLCWCYFGVFLSRMDFSISFTSSLHAFCDAKGARRRNVCIQWMAEGAGHMRNMWKGVASTNKIKIGLVP